MKPTAKDLAFSVVDIFEDLLDEKNIDITYADSSEEEDRRKNESAARIYGTEYGDLVDRVEALLKKGMKNDVQSVEEDDKANRADAGEQMQKGPKV